MSGLGGECGWALALLGSLLGIVSSGSISQFPVSQGGSEWIFKLPGGSFSFSFWDSLASPCWPMGGMGVQYVSQIYASGIFFVENFEMNMKLQCTFIHLEGKFP